MSNEKLLKELEDLRDEFEFEQEEYSKPGEFRDPYQYGMWEGKEQAYEDAKFRLDEIIIAIKEGKV